MPMFTRSLQSGRNQLQATRINAVQQVRGMFGGVMGLQDVPGGNGTVPPAEGFKGLGMGIWPWPVISKIQSGEGLMPAPAAAAQAGLGVPSTAANRGLTGGTSRESRGVY